MCYRTSIIIKFFPNFLDLIYTGEECFIIYFPFLITLKFIFPHSWGSPGYIYRRITIKFKDDSKKEFLIIKNEKTDGLINLLNQNIEKINNIKHPQITNQ